MIRAIKNWWALIKWIKSHRDNDICEFKIITTGSLVIFTTEKLEYTQESRDVHMLRLNYE